MHITDIFARNRTTFSFEFFPPKTAEGAEELFQNITQLEGLKPSFVSVTYGAGGSTRELTHNLVVRIKDTTSLDPIPQARVVKKAGQLVTPPRAPRTSQPYPIRHHLRTMVMVAMGLWPLTAVVLLMIGLLVMAGNHGAP